jgi:hypothetical protein
VWDLSVRAKDLLEHTKLLLWGTNRLGDRATICEAVPVEAWGLIALGSSGIGEVWIAKTDVKSNGLNGAAVKEHFGPKGFAAFHAVELIRMHKLISRQT